MCHLAELLSRNVLKQFRGSHDDAKHILIGAYTIYDAIVTSANISLPLPQSSSFNDKQVRIGKDLFLVGRRLKTILANE